MNEHFENATQRIRFHQEPSKYVTLVLCRFNVGTASATPAQHWINVSFGWGVNL